MAKRQQTESERKDESRPAGSDQQGRSIPAQPSSNDQSGSAGRRAPEADTSRSKDTGQDRYGQSGLGGQQNPETDGQKKYRRSGPDGSETSNQDSNEGSGRVDREERDYKKPKA